jgi:hypothetical protein
VTFHLDPEELIAAIDGELDPARRSHADTCEECRAAIADVGRSIETAQMAVDVPEPSPLFWDYFSARVREATRDERAPAADRWWIAAWKPLVAGALAATVVWAVSVRPADVSPETVAPAAVGVESAASWDEVVEGVGVLTADDMSGLMPVLETALLVEDLTPAERDLFARLIEVEMGSVQ